MFRMWTKIVRLSRHYLSEEQKGMVSYFCFQQNRPSFAIRHAEFYASHAVTTCHVHVRISMHLTVWHLDSLILENNRH